jgi:hypothetical protein
LAKASAAASAARAATGTAGAVDASGAAILAEGPTHLRGPLAFAKTIQAEGATGVSQVSGAIGEGAAAVNAARAASDALRVQSEISNYMKLLKAAQESLEPMRAVVQNESALTDMAFKAADKAFIEQFGYLPVWMK